MGSHAADLAREEAARAEAEPETLPEPDTQIEPDVEPEPEPVPEPEPEQSPEPQGLNDAQIDALWKSVGRENDRHAREVEKRAGPMFADLAPCPCCMAGDSTVAGFIFPNLPEPTQTMRRQFVNIALGGEAPVEYEPDEESLRCERCAGKGSLRRDTDVENQRIRPCPSCNANGWVPNPAVVPTVTPASVYAPPPPQMAAGYGQPTPWNPNMPPSAFPQPATPNGGAY